MLSKRHTAVSRVFLARDEIFMPDFSAETRTKHLNSTVIYLGGMARPLQVGSVLYAEPEEKGKSRLFINIQFDLSKKTEYCRYPAFHFDDRKENPSNKSFSNAYHAAFYFYFLIWSWRYRQLDIC